MFLHNHLSNNFCCACIHDREPLYYTEQCSHRGSVAVDEDKHYITLVYCDTFYELVSLQLLVFVMMFSVEIIT